MANRLRVCVIGAGFFSQFHYDAWNRLAEVDLVGLCALTGDEARAAAARHAVPRWYDDLDAMLDAEAPDLLDIVTPPPTHRACIDAAIGRGIAAVCQKPFCGSLAEAEAAVAAIGQAGATVVVHENFRFQPWYGRIREAIEDGTLGEVYQATFRLRPGDGQGPDAYLDRQPYFRTMERFLVHETAIHLLDVFRFLFGEPACVFARLARLNPAVAGEDAGVILLEFDSGVRALFDGNRLADHAAGNRRLTMGEMLVEGSKATLRLDGWGRLWLRAHAGNDERELLFDWTDRGFGGDCVFRLQSHVVGHLLHGAPLENAAASYLANLRLEEAVYRSHAEGRVEHLTD
jgi:predicted dehydrogenase